MAFFNILRTSRGGTGLSSSGTSGNVLTSNGTVWVSSAPGFSKYTLSAKSANFTANDGTGYYYRVTTTSAVTATLPSSPADGTVLKFKALNSANLLTINPAGGETINQANGTTTTSLTVSYDAGVIELIAVSGGWDET